MADGVMGKFGFTPDERRRARKDWLIENPQFVKLEDQLVRLNDFVLVSIAIRFHPPFRYVLNLNLDVFVPDPPPGTVSAIDPGMLVGGASQQFIFSHSKHTGAGPFVSGLKATTAIKESMDGLALDSSNVSPLKEDLSVRDVIGFLEARLPRQVYRPVSIWESLAVANFKLAGDAYALGEFERARGDFALWPEHMRQMAGGSFEHWRERVGDQLDHQRINDRRVDWMLQQKLKHNVTLKDYRLVER